MSANTSNARIALFRTTADASFIAGPSGALLAMSADRDPELLAALRKRALAPLIEMARWKSKGHALPAFFILSRIAGCSDEVAYDLWERGDRNAAIDAARNNR